MSSHSDVCYYKLATFSHCSSTQPCHVDGKPDSGFHTTFGWNTCWHGQISQSCSEDRSTHRCQHPVCSSRVRWKHGHVHAFACKFSAFGRIISHINQTHRHKLFNPCKPDDSVKQFNGGLGSSRFCLIYTNYLEGNSFCYLIFFSGSHTKPAGSYDLQV